MGFYNNSYTDTLRWLLQLFAVRKTHVPIKAGKINEHILYAELNKHSLANCIHERKLSINSLGKNKNSKQQWLQN